MSLDELINSARTQIEEASDLESLDSVRVEFLGKKGQVTAQLKSLGSLPVEEKKAQGQKINEGKRQLQQALEARRNSLEAAAIDEKLKSEAIDVTLPGRGVTEGGFCLLYTSPSPRDGLLSRMPSSA